MDRTTIPKNIRFYFCATVFRNPEKVILDFPNNLVNYTPINENPFVEIFDSYAAMIGFEYGMGRIIVCTDHRIFRSIDIMVKGEKKLLQYMTQT